MDKRKCDNNCPLNKTRNIIIISGAACILVGLGIMIAREIQMMYTGSFADAPRNGQFLIGSATSIFGLVYGCMTYEKAKGTQNEKSIKEII